MTSTATSLPILDLSRLDDGPEEAEAFRTDLRNATHEFGFFYLVGHGVSEQLQESVIHTAREFFEIEDAADREVVEVKF